MNHTIPTATRISILTLMIVLMALTSEGQDRYRQSGTTKISIAGTSTVHDWTMVSKDATYDAVIETNSKGESAALTSLTLSILAESLKSGKSGMDKNAYSALKTDQNKQITFQLIRARMEGETIHCTGKLTIAGTTRLIDLEAMYTLMPGNLLQCKGSKKILMTDYNMVPPTFMFGSVTTGNEITVSFDVTLATRSLQQVTLN